jgi:hypothetical protein
MHITTLHLILSTTNCIFDSGFTRVLCVLDISELVNLDVIMVNGRLHMWRVHCAYYPTYIRLVPQLTMDYLGFSNVQLVIDRSLASLPRRQTDNAIIMRTQDNSTGKATVFKLNASTNDHSILLKRWVFLADLRTEIYNTVRRDGGCERQYRFSCPRCSLPIGYQTSPPPVKSAPYLYIFSGALSQLQGQVPSDAFDGENDV